MIEELHLSNGDGVAIGPVTASGFEDRIFLTASDSTSKRTTLYLTRQEVVDLITILAAQLASTEPSLAAPKQERLKPGTRVRQRDREGVVFYDDESDEIDTLPYSVAFFDGDVEECSRSELEVIKNDVI